MRVLMKVQISNAVDMTPTNGAPPMLDRMMEQLHPEAAYFYPEDGKRTSIMVFDMESPAQLPPIGEAIHSALGEVSISVTPCMTIDDLRSGLASIRGAAPVGA